MPSEGTKILKISDKIQFIICAGLESSIEKINGCKKRRSTAIVREHIPTGF